MTSVVRHPRRTRPRIPSRTDGTIRLQVPPASPFGKASLALALGALCLLGLALQFGSRLVGSVKAEEDEVQIIQEAPPPPATTEIKPTLKPAPPRPDPDQAPPSRSLTSAPAAPPISGVPEAATTPTGDMAVATGNTLMKPADSVVQAPPPPLPYAPVQLDRQPAILNQVTPVYPAWAEEQGVTATVQLQVTIDARGQVQSVAIVSSGGDDFARSAIKAVRASRFQPWVKDGVAVPARFLFTYRFVL
jgi:periplasmic protein TonB